MRKICIVIDTLIQGGAHRVACLQANSLQLRGYEVTLLFFVKPVGSLFSINDKITQLHLLDCGLMEGSSIKNKIYRRVVILPLLLRKLKQLSPDVIISHIQGVNFYSIIAANLLNVKIIVSEHTTHILPKNNLKNFFASIERKYFYRLADHLTVLTQSELEFYLSEYSIKKAFYLPNPCPFEPLSEGDVSKLFDNREKYILAVGDINRIEIKGWDTLIECFAEFDKKNPGWKLLFVGGSANNSGLNKLTQMSEYYNIKDKVVFAGPSDDVEKFYRAAGMFVLSSRNEGFSMVIVEAMSQGCPVISFDCESGPGEIINNLEDGLIIENQNKQQMISAMLLLSNDIHLQKKLSLSGIVKAQKYSLDSYLNRLTTLIEG
ncbi:glycosyltransferase [Citrobacter freundii]|uniref:glycosyltransferase n=1 Tax=Citrobacter freundii TaxID=546 RepID=UPI0013D6FF6D|nr:glycosyltransferase [Citrobacter freundii]EKX5679216.1 glycosyltransferase [Citrobacter freundii]